MKQNINEGKIDIVQIFGVTVNILLRPLKEVKAPGPYGIHNDYKKLQYSTLGR